MEKYPRATQIALRSVGILYLMVWCVFWHISVTGASEVQRISTGGCHWSHTGSSCCKSLVRCLRYLLLPDTFCGIISVFYFISYVSDLAALLHQGLPCSTACMRLARPPPSASRFLIVFGMFRWFWCYLVLSIHWYLEIKDCLFSSVIYLVLSIHCYNVNPVNAVVKVKNLC